MSWRDDINYGLGAFGIQLPASFPVDDWMHTLTATPGRNAALVVMASAVLFLHFEKGHNPKVKDITDALLYTSTALNVGYADSHPVTKAGKLLASVLMTYGPALATRSMDGPRTADATQVEILATLKTILTKLEDESR